MKFQIEHALGDCLEKSPASGNLKVVAMLERWLEKAREGNINHATITACELPDKVGCDAAGSIEMMHYVPLVLDELKARIVDAVDNLEPPEARADVGADRVCYNGASGPLSYDCITWLVDAEMTRLREGAPAPLKVACWMGKDGKAGLGSEYRLQMLANVVAPSLALIGAVEDASAIGGRRKNIYTSRDITAASRRGEEVPLLKASAKAMATVAGWIGSGPAPVTITLREAEHWPHRNSNMDAWIRFARGLNERVIFIRDTAKATETLEYFATCPSASVDINIRLALYEQAKCNLFVANGPHVLALYGSRPWLMFNEVDIEDDPFLPNNSEWFLKYQGIAVGEQFPWCRDDQRIIWARDTYGNLVAAWGELQSIARAA